MSSTVSEKYNIILSQIKKTIDHPEKNRDEKLQEICQILADEVEIFDWVGFYLVDPEAERELILGPYVGEATDHTRIPFGTGICGQAADTEETFVVQDVSKADNYLACSMEVQSEIVVPVMKDGEFIAELDIDSHTKDVISKDHQNLVEKVCDMISPIF